MMMLSDGRRVDPLRLRGCDVRLRDIAHALSQMCRYGGHAPRFYSVAEHSVVVSRLCATHEARRFALLHDAAEAYIGDVIAPLKDRVSVAVSRGAMIQFDAVERSILSVILGRFGVAVSPAIADAVHRCDMRARDGEMREFWGRGDAALPQRLDCFPPRVAMDVYLRECAHCGIFDPE